MLEDAKVLEIAMRVRQSDLRFVIYDLRFGFTPPQS
jgi:hypothetical protein